MKTQTTKKNKKHLNQKNHNNSKLKKNVFTNQRKVKEKNYHVELYKEDYQYDMWPGFIDD